MNLREHRIVQLGLENGFFTEPSLVEAGADAADAPSDHEAARWLVQKGLLTRGQAESMLAKLPPAPAAPASAANKIGPYQLTKVVGEDGDWRCFHGKHIRSGAERVLCVLRAGLAEADANAIMQEFRKGQRPNGANGRLEGFTVVGQRQVAVVDPAGVHARVTTPTPGSLFKDDPKPGDSGQMKARRDDEDVHADVLDGLPVIGLSGAGLSSSSVSLEITASAMESHEITATDLSTLMEPDKDEAPPPAKVSKRLTGGRSSGNYEVAAPRPSKKKHKGDGVPPHILAAIVGLVMLVILAILAKGIMSQGM